MPEYIPDPDLNELVREINNGPVPEVGESSGSSIPGSTVEPGHPLERLLEEMFRRGASDLLLIPGSPPVFRVNGSLARGGSDPLEPDSVERMFANALRSYESRLRESDAADFSLRITGTAEERPARMRVRVNLHRQRGTIAAAIRALPGAIPTLEELHLPAGLAALVEPMRGLVLVCGPTGSGKSSTLAALVGEINQRRSSHVVTIEDPVEYEHPNLQSVIEHIEIGRDARSFSAAFRSILRQDPDVILVGEMRDLDTMATALTAAETGHLILSTLHTGDSTQAIHRIIDAFPGPQQTQIRQQLAISLNAIVTQQLVPVSGGPGRLPAVEVLIANTPVRNHIRNDRLQNIASEITLGKRQGMISLEESLGALVRERLIPLEEARIRSRRPDELESHLRDPST